MRAGVSKPRLSSLTTAESPVARVLPVIGPHAAVTRLPPESSTEPSHGDVGEASFDRMLPAKDAVALPATAIVDVLFIVESSKVLAVIDSVTAVST